MWIRAGKASGTNGCLEYSKSETHSDNKGSTVGSGTLRFRASNYSDRYGNYTEVNPLYESCLFIIKY